MFGLIGVHTTFYLVPRLSKKQTESPKLTNLFSKCKGEVYHFII